MGNKMGMAKPMAKTSTRAPQAIKKRDGKKVDFTRIVFEKTMLQLFYVFRKKMIHITYTWVLFKKNYFCASASLSTRSVTSAPLGGRVRAERSRSTDCWAKPKHNL